RRGRRRISGKRLRSIGKLKSQGMSNRAIAHRLGVSEKAVRKLVGPSEPVERTQLALTAITTEADRRRSARCLRQREAEWAITPPEQQRRTIRATCLSLRTTTSRYR